MGKSACRQLRQREGRATDTVAPHRSRMLCRRLARCRALCDTHQVRSCHLSCRRPQWAAKLFDPKSGRAVDFYTTAPAIIVYTGNW